MLGDRVAEWKRLMKIENKPTRVPRKQNKDELIVIDLKDDIEDMKDSEKNVSQKTKKRNQKPITQKPQETAKNKRHKNDLEDDGLGSDYSMEHESDSNSDYSFNGEPMGDREFNKLMEKKVYLPVPKELRPRRLRCTECKANITNLPMSEDLIKQHKYLYKKTSELGTQGASDIIASSKRWKKAMTDLGEKRLEFCKEHRIFDYADIINKYRCRDFDILKLPKRIESIYHEIAPKLLEDNYSSIFLEVLLYNYEKYGRRVLIRNGRMGMEEIKNFSK